MIFLRDVDMLLINWDTAYTYNVQRILCRMTYLIPDRIQHLSYNTDLDIILSLHAHDRVRTWFTFKLLNNNTQYVSLIS